MPKKPLLAIAIAAAFLVAFAFATLSGSTRAGAQPLPKSLLVKTTFLPSRNGFAFRNPRPDPSTSKFKQLTSGRCGGMAFGSIDLFESGKRIREGRQLDSFIAKRSADSILMNITRFAQWSVSPNVARSPLETGIGQVTRDEEVPRIADELRSGPLPLGLVRARNLREIGLNHQVVAYGLERKGDQVIVRIYDSCQPKADDVTLRMSLADPRSDIREYAGDTVVASWRGLFVEFYSRADMTAR